MAGPLNFLLILALGVPAPRTPAPCLSYEPDTVAITGKLVRRMFYGAPNFGEDPDHDTKEVGFYLELPAPACTLANKDNDAATGVRLVQLVLDSAGYASLRPMLNRTVTLRGSLFAAITGHHHAPILLIVSKPVRTGFQRDRDLTNAEAAKESIESFAAPRQLLLNSLQLSSSCYTAT